MNGAVRPSMVALLGGVSEAVTGGKATAKKMFDLRWLAPLHVSNAVQYLAHLGTQKRKHT